MKLKDVIMLLLLAALWGGSFLFMRIGAPVLGSLVLIELRVLLASITLILFALASRHQIHVLHRWWQYLLLGATNAAIPFTLISFAELRLDAGLAAILNATTPMFTAVVAWLWTKDPFTLKKLSGVLLGIVGVGVLVGWSSGGNGSHRWLSASFSLLAALFYGIAGVFSSRNFKGEKPMDMAIGQQLAASLILLPFSLATLPREIPSCVVIFSVLGLAVLCTAVAYLLYFALIHSVGALKTLTVTFLVPVFGVIWGGLFLNEPITFRLILGLLIILSSVALVANVRFKRTRN
ncbi:multidrug DMT transporter permease [Alicyclobacillus hesperidum]|uniref:Multidrug DMT transporter permease n=1 Tax=Alicyclobacillus hesperidum TaxID=89784 RepID=A0A1H2TVS9_9BACL|nr:EamA family transporter [Alicyclobacillus hesperidum]GLV15003.1 multidrug DMT transporter permease [Alicyclobacillus hesperidum]SDW48013.1 Threonine/homoserine efflux transporter RhtA [Alicyclobacillus hesperidum]